MLKNKTSIIFIFSIVFISGFFFGCLFSKWEIINYSFYSINLTSTISVFVALLQILVFLFIATHINRFINLKANLDLKKKEFFIELINKLEKKIDIIFNFGYHYMNDENNENENDILLNFRHANNIIIQIEHIINKCDIIDLDVNDIIYLKDKIISWRIEITNSPFKTKPHKYDDVTKISFNETYRELNERLFFLKINICV